MRRAYPYRGENSRPGKDIVGKLDTQTKKICQYRKSPRSFDGADDPTYSMGMTAAEDIIP